MGEVEELKKFWYTQRFPKARIYMHNDVNNVNNDMTPPSGSMKRRRFPLIHCTVTVEH